MSTASEISNITISEVKHYSQIRAVEELQKEVWGVPDLEVVPATHLVATREAGGVLIGAFDGETLVGFIYGFPSFERGEAAHHSHMLAVKPTYRNCDLGYRLKLAQREHVVSQGLKLISWTFDPLQSVNAYFNFSKLGALTDRYLANFYGEDAASFLHQTGTDRFWVSWLVGSDRVARRIVNHNDHAILVGNPLVEIAADESSRRNDAAECFANKIISIEIPADINSLYQTRPEVALRWREDTRWAFTEAFNAGYVAVEFVRAKRGEQRVGAYLLSKGKLDDFARTA